MLYPDSVIKINNINSDETNWNRERENQILNILVDAMPGKKKYQDTCKELHELAAITVPIAVGSGVVQGSVLGPLIFILFILIILQHMQLVK